MEEAQDIANRIRRLIKSKGLTLIDFFNSVDLKSVNTLSEMAKGKEMSYVSFCKIAEKLDVSTDYLLGRTEFPEVIQFPVNINGDNNIQLKNSNKTIYYNSSDKMVSDFIKEFCNLDFEKQVKAMNFVIDLKNKN